MSSPDVPQYPPRADWCEDGQHKWHCDDDNHFDMCFCVVCDYWAEWLLK